MSLLDAPSDGEVEEIFKQTWEEEVAGKQRGGSIGRFTFRANLRLGERDLKKRGQLDLFRKTQTLPDYPEAEAAIKAGWNQWLWQECRIEDRESGDTLELNQVLLLYGLRNDQSAEARQERLRRCSNLIEDSKARGEKAFLRKLRHSRAEPPRQRKGYRQCIQLLLANWLIAFWWLMPLKAIASHMARTEGKAQDDFYPNLRQIKTRKSPTDWGRFFYAADPPLIDCINEDNSPAFSKRGKLLLE